MVKITSERKGDVSDILTFMIIVFFLVTSMLVMAFVNDKIKETIETTQLNTTSISSDIVDQMDSITTTGIQNGTLMMIAFLIIGMMISAFMVRIHPIFLFLYIIFLVVSLVVAVPLANSYQLLMEADAIAAVASQQTYLTWIMRHFLKIILAVGGLSITIVFGKLREGTGGRI